MTERPSSVPPALPKVDPETLVLRAPPRPVVRFRRGAIIAIAALASTAVVGAAWLSLKPASFRLAGHGDDSIEIGARPAADTLAGAPASYGDIPRLGPPLPGDLGRPILAQQRQLAGDEAGLAEASRRAAQDGEAERQRDIADQRAARQSTVLVPLGGKPQPAAVPVAAGVAPAVPGGGPAGQLAPDPGPDPNRQHHKLEFLREGGPADDTNPHALAPAPSPFTLSAGSVIAASLITGLNSDLPGLVTAQVTEHAYDSATGRTLLIPQGSRLIGRYDSKISFGQSRALLVWQRILLPDGSAIRIDNMPATDAAGRAGLADRIDRHGWQLLKGVALSTLLGVGSELSLGSGESDLVRAVRESAQQGGGRAGDQLVSRNLDVQPTIRVRPGWPLRVVVHKDILLQPWRGGER